MDYILTVYIVKTPFQILPNILFKWRNGPRNCSTRNKIPRGEQFCTHIIFKKAKVTEELFSVRWDHCIVLARNLASLSYHKSRIAYMMIGTNALETNIDEDLQILMKI